jgi:DNA-binding transcriptional LysR family regulator
VELRAVDTFLVLAEELHFGRAAARLHVTQGRVSQMIRALEREVGGALFERTSRMVRLTPLGAEFRRGAQAGRDELARTLRDCQAMARGISGQLRVGYNQSVGGRFVTGLVSAFERRYPQCQVVLTAVILGRDLAGLFQAGTVPEVVLTWSPGGDGSVLEEPGLSVGPVLAEEGRAVVVPVGHPLAGLETVSVEDLADYVMLHPVSSVSARFSAAWTPLITPSGRPIRHTAEDIHTMIGRDHLIMEDVLALVARGVGLHCTVLSALERSPFPGLTAVPVRDLPPVVVVPIWVTAAENALVRTFVEFAASHP